MDLHAGPEFPADFINITPASISASIAFSNRHPKHLDSENCY
jgi:hypothetical protein